MKKLLVESPNDQHFIKNLFKKIKGLGEKDNVEFEIVPCGGISEVLKRIPAELITPGIETLAIVVDADEDLLRNWNDVKKVFEKYNYQISETPKSEGEIIDKQGVYPKIGIWLMPNNLTTGILEDFIAKIISEDDKLKPIVIEILDDIEKKGLHLYKPQYRPKALIHTWLAWQKEPGKPFGWAITLGYFDSDSKLTKTFISWLDKLFID
jgi:hypothetical protein